MVVTRRRSLVESLYRQGLSTADIADQASKEFPSATERNVTNDIYVIRTRWKEQVREVFDNDVRSWFVYIALSDRAAAIKAGDLKLAYNIARDLAKLAGINLTDLVVDHRDRPVEKIMTWIELMAAERERKGLPPADYRSVTAEVTATRPPADGGQEP